VEFSCPDQQCHFHSARGSRRQRVEKFSARGKIGRGQQNTLASIAYRAQISALNGAAITEIIADDKAGQRNLGNGYFSFGAHVTVHLETGVQRHLTDPFPLVLGLLVDQPYQRPLDLNCKIPARSRKSQFDVIVVAQVVDNVQPADKRILQVNNAQLAVRAGHAPAKPRIEGAMQNTSGLEFTVKQLGQARPCADPVGNHVYLHASRRGPYKSVEHKSACVVRRENVGFKKYFSPRRVDCLYQRGKIGSPPMQQGQMVVDSELEIAHSPSTSG
jgi:hypothetical protein